MLKKNLIVLGAGAILLAGGAHAAVIVDADGPDTVTGPTFGAGFEVDNLFDSTVADSDIDNTEFGGVDGQWAGPGIGPHEIFMDYGASVTASGVAYSQRAGADLSADKVETIEFWFSDTDFGGTFPVTAADVTVTVTNTTDTTLTNYAFGGSFSGRYVAARFTAVDFTGQTNPGGTEMRLTVPEPGSLALLGLGGLLIARRRRA